MRIKWRVFSSVWARVDMGINANILTKKRHTITTGELEQFITIEVLDEEAAKYFRTLPDWEQLIVTEQYILRNVKNKLNVIKSRIQRAQLEYNSYHTLRVTKGEAPYVDPKE